jgi:hypothetical protein
MRKLACLALLTWLTACADDPLPPGRILLTSGHEASVWSQSPAVKKIQVIELTGEGEREEYSELPVPAKGDSAVFDLPDAKVASYEVRGVDAGGEVRVLGRSWPYDSGALAGFTYGLYVGRVGAFGRPPGELAAGQGSNTPVAMLGGRFLISLGAQKASSVPLDGYDFGAWAPNTQESLPCPAEPCKARSLAVAGGTILVAIGDKWAVTNDYGFSSTSGASELGVPPGIDAWSEVAGGATVVDPDGNAYVVGGTREEEAANAVVRIAADGAVTVHQLLTARAGASAAWVPERGLLVVGGAESGAGAELLPEGASKFVALDYASDATTGAALVVYDERQVLRVGGQRGTEPARTALLDAACSKDCALAPYAEPAGLVRASAFDLPEGGVLAIGSDSEGTTLARRLDDTGWTDLALRERRRGASAVRTVLGHIVVVGGVDTSGTALGTIEVFTPACLGSGCEP